MLRLKRRLLETRVSEVNFYFEHSWESGRKKMAGAVDDRDGRGPPEDIWQRARKIFENGRQRTESAPAASFQSLDKKWVLFARLVVCQIVLKTTTFFLKKSGSEEEEAKHKHKHTNDLTQATDLGYYSQFVFAQPMRRRRWVWKKMWKRKKEKEEEGHRVSFFNATQ